MAKENSRLVDLIEMATGQADGDDDDDNLLDWESELFKQKSGRVDSTACCCLRIDHPVRSTATKIVHNQFFEWFIVGVRDPTMQISRRCCIHPQVNVLTDHV